LFDSLPNQAQLGRIVETGEVHHALGGCGDIIRLKQQANVVISVPSWQRFVETWQRQGTSGQVSEFDEEWLDSECIKMRMLALWEADEAMNCGVSERDHPSAFLA
jgi:hypothetical protein